MSVDINLYYKVNRKNILYMLDLNAKQKSFSL